MSLNFLDYYCPPFYKILVQDEEVDIKEYILILSCLHQIIGPCIRNEVKCWLVAGCVNLKLFTKWR